MEKETTYIYVVTIKYNDNFTEYDLEKETKAFKTLDAANAYVYNKSISYKNIYNIEINKTTLE